MGDESHVDNSDNKGWDGDDNCSNDTPENVALFTSLETTRTFFDGGTFFE